MNKKELEAKLKRSLQVLLYLFEVKTKIKTVAKNINFNYWNIYTNGAIYFELELIGTSDDPDPTTVTNEIKKVSDMIYDFFNKKTLDDDSLSFVNGDPSESDDMVGLLMSINFNWAGGEGDNMLFTFAFEYNFYNQEITE